MCIANEREGARGRGESTGVEANFSARGIRRSHELADGVEDDAEMGVVVLFQGCDLAGEGFDRKRHPAQFYKGADHGDAHGFGLFAVEHVGGHDGAMFGKGIGLEANVSFGCGRNLRPDAFPGCGRKLRPQSSPLFWGELKRKVFGEAFGVSFDLFIEALDGDAVEGGEIGVEQNGLAAQTGDALFGGAGQDQFVVCGGFHAARLHVVHPKDRASGLNSRSWRACGQAGITENGSAN